MNDHPPAGTALRVLFVSNLFPNREEPARGIFNLRQMQHLARRCAVRVVAPIPWFFVRGRLNPARPVPAEELIDGLPVAHPKALYLPVIGRTLNPWLYGQSAKGTIARIRREFPFDVVYVNWAYPDACGIAPVARAMRVPFVVSVSGSDANRYLDYRIRRRQILGMIERAQAVTVRSRALKELLVSHRVPAAKVHVLYNGVEKVQASSSSRDSIRRSLGLNPGERALIYVGRLSPEKGVADLFDALAILRDRHAMAPRLLVLGDGIEREPLRRQAARLGVDPAIVWLGWQKPADVAGMIAATDLLCLPSHMEGVPNAALEAFAAGRPVVATRVGGTPEVVTPETGVLAEPRSPQSLAAALREALGRAWDPALIAAHARRFDWDENARQLHAILRGGCRP